MTPKTLKNLTILTTLIDYDDNDKFYDSDNFDEFNENMTEISMNLTMN